VQVKNLLTLPPQDETPVRNCTIRKIPRYSTSALLVLESNYLVGSWDHRKQRLYFSKNHVCIQEI
jgi:hypothetical protein